MFQTYINCNGEKIVEGSMRGVQFELSVDSLDGVKSEIAVLDDGRVWYCVGRNKAGKRILAMKESAGEYWRIEDESATIIDDCFAGEFVYDKAVADEFVRKVNAVLNKIKKEVR
jgi:hypothetical protein